MELKGVSCFYNSFTIFFTILLQFFFEKFGEFQIEAHVNQGLFWANKNKS